MIHKHKNSVTTQKSVATSTAQLKGGISLPPPSLAMETTKSESENQEQDYFIDSKMKTALPTAPSDNGNNISSFQLSASTSPIQKKKSAVTQAFSPPANVSSNSLPTAVRGKMEGAFQADFSDVAVHQNSSEATGLGAQAFARGNDIHFAPGKFNPNSSQKQELIGHELTHIIQQRKGMVKPTIQAKGLAINDDAALEQQADEMGHRAANFKGGSSSNAFDSSNNSNTSSVIQGQFRGGPMNRDPRVRAVEWMAGNVLEQEQAIRNPEQVDPSSRLGAMQATGESTRGQVGYGANPAIRGIHTVFGNAGQQEIGDVFNSSEAQELMAAPNTFENNRKLGALEHDYWKSQVGQGETWADEGMIRFGAAVPPWARAGIQMGTGAIRGVKDDITTGLGRLID